MGTDQRQTHGPLSALADVEKGLQLCSRIAQGLNVPTAYDSAFHSLQPSWKAFLNILLYLLQPPAPR